MDKVKKIASIFFPVNIMFVVVTSILYYEKFAEMPFFFIFNFVQLLLWGHFYGVVVFGKNFFKKEQEQTELQKNITQQKLEHKNFIEKAKNYEDFLTQLKNQNISTQFDENALNVLSKYIEIIVAVVYKKIGESNFEPIATYALPEDVTPQKFQIDEGFCGQVVKDKSVLIIPEIPENYFTSFSGLGKGTPRNLVFIPLLEKGKVEGLIEIGLFKVKNNYNEFFEKISKNFVNDIKN